VSSIRDLCTIGDVLRYVPAYVSNTATNAQLEASITSESEDIHDETGRLIIPWADQPETRAYTIDRPHAHAHRVDIDDLASAGDTDITVELIGRDGAVVATVDRDAYRPLYENRRQANAPWEPITALEFPRALSPLRFLPGQTLLVTGNFGFPMVPPFIVEACAKRVILRYASDVAAAGTQLAAAIAEINLAGLFASSRDDIYRLKRMTMIA
jgi:hypothetical protein